MRAGYPSKPVLSVFDFDHTLTYRDSFTFFLRTKLGTFKYATGMRATGIPAAQFLAKVISRDELKGRLIRNFMHGFSVAQLEDLSDDFCRKYWARLMRPNATAAVASELQSGATVTLCSASPEIVLRPFAERLGVHLIGTKLEVVDGILTGKIAGKNCRKAEKVERLKQIYGALSKYHLRAWGDSDGDKELLEAADEPFYRLFH